MENYLLTRFENDRETEICRGTSVEGLRKLVENSQRFFKDGYCIYELKLVEYGIKDENSHKKINQS